MHLSERRLVFKVKDAIASDVNAQLCIDVLGTNFYIIHHLSAYQMSFRTLSLTWLLAVVLGASLQRTMTSQYPDIRQNTTGVCFTGGTRGFPVIFDHIKQILTSMAEGMEIDYFYVVFSY